MDREPASFLPEHIRDALKRKSSRDPASRFHTKLHLLLSYSSDVPSVQDQLGLCWASDDEFRMNKSVLCEVMGIKLNTLNVNLRDLHFRQLQRDKEGWTVWKRPGFTRAANAVEHESDPTLSPLRRAGASAEPAFVPLPRATPPTFSLGRLTDFQCARFFGEAQRLWTDVLECHPTFGVSADVVIDKAAGRFRYEEQPLQNARDVIDAIIRPAATDSRLVFADFSRFMAMFGPENTLMLKIASLLTCSNGSGNWLTFERAGGARAPFAAFDPTMPNCLVVHHGDRTTERVYNNPTAESGREPYVIDEYGKAYRDWDEWFGRHPVRQAPAPFAFP
jgi:hypothetical protein